MINKETGKHIIPLDLNFTCNMIREVQDNLDDTKIACLVFMVFMAGLELVRLLAGWDGRFFVGMFAAALVVGCIRGWRLTVQLINLQENLRKIEND